MQLLASHDLADSFMVVGFMVAFLVALRDCFEYRSSMNTVDLQLA